MPVKKIADRRIIMKNRFLSGLLSAALLVFRLSGISGRKHIPSV